VIFFLIWTWRRGRELMLQGPSAIPCRLRTFIKQIHGKSRVPGRGLLTSRTDVVPVPLLHNLNITRSSISGSCCMHVVTERAVHRRGSRIQVYHLMDGFSFGGHSLRLLEQPDIPQVLDAAARSSCGSI